MAIPEDNNLLKKELIYASATDFAVPMSVDTGPDFHKGRPG